MDSWLEKYRPTKIQDTELEDHFKEYLEKLVEMKNLPNMIINGPPGIGKTTIAHCLAREILEENYQKYVLELNASDERGIDVIRSKIVEFTELKDKGNNDSVSKILIFDECDMLTTAAQQALRMIITNNKKCRFIFICNNSTKIIDPIISRCIIINLGIANDIQIERVLLKISKKENIDLNNEGKDALLFLSEGDIRKAINSMQATHITFNLINRENVFKINELPDLEELKKIIKWIWNKDLKQVMSNILYLNEKGNNWKDIINLLIKLFENFKFYFGNELNSETIYEILFQLNLLKTKLLEIKSNQRLIVIKYIIKVIQLF